MMSNDYSSLQNLPATGKKNSLNTKCREMTLLDTNFMRLLSDLGVRNMWSVGK